MSQDYHHQSLASFSNGFERPQVEQEQEQQRQPYITHQIRGEKLRVEGFEPPPPLVAVEGGGGSSGIQVYEPAGMLSEMFNFQITATAASATELLHNQLSHNYRHPNQQPPTTDLGNEWFGNRQGVVVGGNSQVPLEDEKDSNSKLLNNRDSVTAYYQRQHSQIPSINTAESNMQLFLTNPLPRSPSTSSSQPSTSTLQGFPSHEAGGHFGQFIFGGASPPNNPIGGVNVIEGQGLSLSLSSSLHEHLEAAKMEELRMSSSGGSDMMFFNQGSQNHHQFHHVGFGSSLGLVNVLRNSKYAKAAQELLEEFCSVGKGQLLIKKVNKVSKNNNTNPSGSNNNSSSSKDIPPNLSPADRLDHQRRKVKLLSMLDEVDKRYNHYCEQMQMVVNSFDLVMGFGAALPYTALAQKAMSRHFKCLKDGVAAQLKQSCELLGEKVDASTSAGLTKGETPRLKVLEQSMRQQRAFQQMGMTEQEAAWRPQRGLPERSVNILRAWLFEHFLHPYPSDADKHLLARQTGLSRNQVANWFINARVRLWKPMVEDMYQREAKEDDDMQNNTGQNQNSTSNTNAQTPTPNTTETKSVSTATINTTVASDKINAPENDPSMNSYSSSVAHQTNFPTVQDSDHILSRREPVSGGEYGTTNMASSEIGSTMIRFGTTAGDVSLTLGLRHAGNIPENTHFLG